MQLAEARNFRRFNYGRFCRVHPRSVMGDLSHAWQLGWDFVGFIPNAGEGVYLLRFAGWWAVLWRGFVKEKGRE